MPKVAEEPHRRFITPARALIGSLIAGAGLTVLGFLAGGTSASAAEPAPPPGAVGSLVSSVTGGVGDTVGAVTQAVTPAVPAPVQDVVSAVVTPVADVVDQVADQAPVASVVEPVASTMDEVVAAVPVVRDVLPPAPVASVTQPVAGTVDQAVSDVADAVDTAVAPLAPSTTDISTPAPDLGLVAADVLAALGAPQALSTPLAATLGAAGPGVTVFAGAPPLPLSAGASSVGTGPLGGAPSAPGGDPGRGLPAGGSVGSSGAAGGGPGGAAPSAAATADRFFLPGSVRSGLSGAASDDHVPGGPVADHDISPD